MYSHFVWYLGFCSTEEDQIQNGANLHIAYPILSIFCLLMPWWLKEPGCQQALYWPNKPDYSVTRRVNTSSLEEDGRHFANIFRFNFLCENYCIFIKVSLRFVPNGLVDNKAAIGLWTHLYVIWPRWPPRWVNRCWEKLPVKLLLKLGHG